MPGSLRDRATRPSSGSARRANREDDQIAAEFRRLTEQGLRARKAANLDHGHRARWRRRGPEGRASTSRRPWPWSSRSPTCGWCWGSGWACGPTRTSTQLEEQVAALDDDDPAVYALAVYDFLTWLQETLAHALLALSRL